jgi:hypothetical protein
MDYSENKNIIEPTIIIVFLLLTFAAWYYVCFMNGAQEWYRQIARNYRFLGIEIIESDFFFKPKVLKIFITLFLLFTIFGCYLVVISENFMK